MPVFVAALEKLSPETSEIGLKFNMHAGKSGTWLGYFLKYSSGRGLCLLYPLRHKAVATRITSTFNTRLVVGSPLLATCCFRFHPLPDAFFFPKGRYETYRRSSFDSLRS